MNIQEKLKNLVDQGLTFTDCVLVFGVPSCGDDADPIARLAKANSEEGELEVDDVTVISPSDNGAYVMAWMWVDAPSANTPA